MILSMKFIHQMQVQVFEEISIFFSWEKNVRNMVDGVLFWSEQIKIKCWLICEVDNEKLKSIRYAFDQTEIVNKCDSK